jgi:ABC-type transport system involved in resistance to organic solvents, ATPase component
VIEIKNLKKRFGKKEVLRGVNLSIKTGETMVIIGRSGCGKSVLLKHIVGLLKGDEGEVIVDGQIISSMSREELYRIRTKFGYLFQGAALFDSMTVGENVGLALRENYQMSEQKIREIVAEKLALVGLPNIEQMKPSELSGGMRKRVGLARALATNPEYIFYDEPTTGLDPIMSDAIDTLIKTLLKNCALLPLLLRTTYRASTVADDRHDA